MHENAQALGEERWFGQYSQFSEAQILIGLLQDVMPEEDSVVLGNLFESRDYHLHHIFEVAKLIEIRSIYDICRVKFTYLLP